MSIIVKKLDELKLSKHIADVRRERLCDETLTGIVVDFSDEFLCLGLITDDGEYNGISVIFREHITRINIGGNARKSVDELTNFRSTEIEYPPIKLTVIQDIISSIQTAYGYVNLQTENTDADICFIGKLIEQDENWVSMQAYGTLSSRDVYDLLIDKDEITRIDAGAMYEESIRYLAEKSKS